MVAGTVVFIIGCALENVSGPGGGAPSVFSGRKNNESNKIAPPVEPFL